MLIFSKGPTVCTTALVKAAGVCPGCCGTVNLYSLGQWALGNGQKFIERGKEKRQRHFRP